MQAQAPSSLRDQYFQRLARVAQAGGGVHAFGTEVLEEGCSGEEAASIHKAGKLREWRLRCRSP